MTEDPSAFLIVLRRKANELIAILDRYEKSLSPSTVLNKEQIQQAFPEDLRNELTFETEDEAFIIRPKGFLGHDIFTKAFAIVADKLGGKYVSAGKDSHFRVPKKAQP